MRRVSVCRRRKEVLRLCVVHTFLWMFCAYNIYTDYDQANERHVFLDVFAAVAMHADVCFPIVTLNKGQECKWTCNLVVSEVVALPLCLVWF